MVKESQTKRFCNCIKKVARTQKNKESAAIPICIKSVLQSRGRTIKRFQCRKGKKGQSGKRAYVLTQPMKS